MDRELICQCGCGEAFTQSRVGRARKYKNATHKSRANNKRTSEAVKRGASLEGAALLRYMCDSMETEDIAAWYPELTTEQWIVLDAIRNTTLTYDAFVAAMLTMAGWH